MKDYYQILGIGDRASQEEIRDRWVELAKLSHPDLEGGTEKNERIREINEAYQILSTPNLKFEYDLRRSFQSSVLKHLAYSREKRKLPFKRVIFYCLFSAIFLVVGSFILFFETPWVSKEYEGGMFPETTQLMGPYPPLKSEEYEKSEKPEDPVKSAKMVPPVPTLRESPEEVKESPMVFPPGEKRESEPIKEVSGTGIKGPERPDSVAAIALREPNRSGGPVESKGSPVASSLEVDKKSEPIKEASAIAVKRPEKLEEAKKVPLLEPTRTLPPIEPKESPPASPLVGKGKSEAKKEVPAPALKERNLTTREANVIPSPSNKTVIPEAAKTPTSSSVLHSISGESEVRQFLAQYTDRYNQKEINSFISFFSPKAIQNQKEDIEKIRKIYANFFQHTEELRYKVRDVKIEPHKDGFKVAADYELEGVLKKGKQRKVWRGQVRWVLIKEEGNLKILSLDYQPQK
jgi:curved DNA-binding protein CbpA